MGQIFKFFLVIALVYLVFVGAFLGFRKEFIYPFLEVGAAPADMPRTRVAFIGETFEDPRLEVWVTEPEAGQPVILYFMGNAGVLSVHEPRLRELAKAGFGIAAMAYRGGGSQGGTPSEIGLKRDAARLYAALDDLMGAEVPGDDRVIYGYGLGSALAVDLAAREDEMALVLEAPFASMCSMLERSFVAIPACRIMWDETYDSAALIGKVDTTVLFLHGARDPSVPISEGRALFRAAKAPKFNKVYPRGTHIDLARFGAAQDVIGFLRILRGGS